MYILPLTLLGYICAVDKTGIRIHDVTSLLLCMVNIKELDFLWCNFIEFNIFAVHMKKH